MEAVILEWLNGGSYRCLNMMTTDVGNGIFITSASTPDQVKSRLQNQDGKFSFVNGDLIIHQHNDQLFLYDEKYNCIVKPLPIPREHLQRLLYNSPLRIVWPLTDLSYEAICCDDPSPLAHLPLENLKSNGLMVYPNSSTTNLTYPNQQNSTYQNSAYQNPQASLGNQQSIYSSSNPVSPNHPTPVKPPAKNKPFTPVAPSGKNKPHPPVPPVPPVPPSGNNKPFSPVTPVIPPQPSTIPFTPLTPVSRRNQSNVLLYILIVIGIAIIMAILLSWYFMADTSNKGKNETEEEE